MACVALHTDIDHSNILSINGFGATSSADGDWALRGPAGRCIVDDVKYVFLICDDETVSPSMEEIRADPAYQAYDAEKQRRGRSLGGARLRPVVSATTVRVRDGETLVSDGPFAETKDFVGGIDIVECADLDEAIALAALHPYAGQGCIEVRPVWE